MAKELKMEIQNVDDLFKISNNNGKIETVVMIPINNISNFPNHPYKIQNNEEMQEMIESISNGGIQQPVIVRINEEGNYEMVSGHRRKFACEKLGIREIPAIVRKLSRDEATILMVDSNIQREKILPSEKAFAYKMKLEAIKRQAGRPKKDNARQVVRNLESADIIGMETGESDRQVQRYIRLSELIKLLLDIVVDGKVAFSPAVEISYLSKDEQYVLSDCIKKFDATPSQAQAIHMKKLSQEGKLIADKIEEIMEEEKPNQIPKYRINYSRFEKYLPRNIVTEKEVEDFLFSCV